VSGSLNDPAIGGTCAPGFERVHEAFVGNFAAGGEVGAAVAVWVQGDLVVNLWGGYSDSGADAGSGTRQPWRENTLASVFSGTKGLTSTCVHLLADRGEIDLDAPVARYWPEFAQSGKEAVTVASVLGHRSGVIAPRQRLHWDEVSDWDLVCTRLAAAEPWWEPGSAQGYHMVAFGFILGEVVRRVTGRSLGQYLRTEIAEPMGIDVHVGLPDFEHQRCAEMVNKPHIRGVLSNGGAPSDPCSLAEHPMAGLSVAMGFVPDDELGSNDLPRWRRSEFPGTNGHVSALGLARRRSSPAASWRSRGSPRAVSIPTSCWARGWPTTAGVWVSCSTSAGSPGPTRAASATAAREAPTGSSTSSTGSATPT